MMTHALPTFLKPSAWSLSAMTGIFGGMALFLLTGCAPGHLLVEQGDLNQLDARLSAVDEGLLTLSQAQQQAVEALNAQCLQAQQELQHAFAQNLDEVLAKIPVCPPPPVCPQPLPPPQAQSTAPPPAPTRLGDKQVIGAIEQVSISPPGIVFTARIDTGAESASLDARDIQPFERDGQRWVRFVVVDRESQKRIELERRVLRYVRVVQAVTDEAERRPVVEFHLQLGTLSQTAEFTLSDRSHLQFPVLIGRNVLQDMMLVDVGMEYIAPLPSPTDNPTQP